MEWRSVLGGTVYLVMHMSMRGSEHEGEWRLANCHVPAGKDRMMESGMPWEASSTSRHTDKAHR